MLAVLFEAAVRSLALAALVGVGLYLLPRRNPRAEFVVWTGVLGASLAMPFLMGVISLPSGAIPLAAPAQPEFAVAEFNAAANALGGTRAVDWLLVGYLAGAAVLLARWGLGLFLTRRLLADAEPVVETGCPYPVRRSSALTAPVSFAGTIFVPADYAAWPAATRSAVLAHEGDHIARGDFYVLTFALLHRAVFWFSPLSWWIVRRLTGLAEVLSDEAALAALGNGRAVVAVLRDFAVRNADAPAALAMARPATLRARVERLLSDPEPSKPLHAKTLAAIAGILLPLAMLAGASMTARADVAATYQELVEGNPKAKVTVVEYASMTCPHCARFYTDSFPKLKKDYIDTGKIRFVFRDLPTAPRELAFAAAQLARCATGDRGLKLIEMMYKNQQDWMQNPQVTLRGYAQLAGITPGEFDSCLKNENIYTAMNKSIDQASTVYKVESTPTFFVGETKVSGEDYAPLQKAIDQALAAAK